MKLAILCASLLLSVQAVHAEGAGEPVMAEPISAILQFPPRGNGGQCEQQRGTCEPGFHLGPGGCQITPNGMRTPVCDCCPD